MLLTQEVLSSVLLICLEGKAEFKSKDKRNVVLGMVRDEWLQNFITNLESRKIWDIIIGKIKWGKWYFNWIDWYGFFMVFLASFFIKLQFEVELVTKKE